MTFTRNIGLAISIVGVITILFLISVQTVHPMSPYEVYQQNTSQQQLVSNQLDFYLQTIERSLNYNDSNTSARCCQ